MTAVEVEADVTSAVRWKHVSRTLWRMRGTSRFDVIDSGDWWTAIDGWVPGVERFTNRFEAFAWCERRADQ